MQDMPITDIEKEPNKKREKAVTGQGSYAKYLHEFEPTL